MDTPQLIGQQTWRQKTFLHVISSLSSKFPGFFRVFQKVQDSFRTLFNRAYQIAACAIWDLYRYTSSLPCYHQRPLPKEGLGAKRKGHPGHLC